jgi:hypothetical protein
VITLTKRTGLLRTVVSSLSVICVHEAVTPNSWHILIDDQGRQLPEKRERGPQAWLTFALKRTEPIECRGLTEFGQSGAEVSRRVGTGCPCLRAGEFALSLPLCRSPKQRPLPPPVATRTDGQATKETTAAHEQRRRGQRESRTCRWKGRWLSLSLRLQTKSNLWPTLSTKGKQEETAPRTKRRGGKKRVPVCSMP